MNKIEEYKSEKDGLDILTDVPRYAAEGWEAITDGDRERLKWAGVFFRKQTPGRFMMRVRMGYPDLEDEKMILRQQLFNSAVERLAPVMHSDEVLQLQREAREVAVDEALLDYLIRIVRATRQSDLLDLGVSPRGSLALYHAAQAMAFIEGRDYVIPDDIKRLVVPVFAHRIVVNSRYSTGMRRSDEAEAALQEILKTVSVPL